MKTAPAAWIAIGIGLGAALGSAWDNMSAGIALGASFGVAMFAIAHRKQKRSDEE